MPYKPGTRPSRAKPGAKVGRPSKAREAARAVALADRDGIPLEEAAQRLGVGKSVAYRLKAVQESVDEPADEEEGAVEEDDDDLVDVETATRDRVLKLIAKCERRLLKAPAARFTAIGSLLERLYARLAALTPKPPTPPDAVLEELKRLDMGTIGMIEQHLADRITSL